MLYSKNLLKHYLSLDVEIEKIADELTLKSCEVEEIHQRKLPHDVVIGKVTEVKKHPNADKLFVCQIDCGDKGKYQICTGGENVVTDSYVPVALPGCFLPSINLKIEPREMRGEESNGMICSKEELGIPEDIDKHWIWTMQKTEIRNQKLESGKQKTENTCHPEFSQGSHEIQDGRNSGLSLEGYQIFDFDDITDDDLGVPLGEKYPWLENRVLDVENKTITHRPDMFGHFGLSIELEAIFPNKVKYSGASKYKKQIQEENIFQTLEHANQSTRKVKVETDDVFTYIALEINDVKRNRSDLYLRTLLYDLELQPRANWVDFSNIFMYLTGQPVHFFDTDKIDGDIIVRNARDGETFVDLFDKEHTLKADDIVIADKTKILALAGVVGSKTSGIDENTKNIIVEIANFDEVKVRKTGTRLGLRTDAEIRFEKGINPLYSLHTLTMLLDELQYFKKSLGNYEIGGLSRYTSDHAQKQVMKRIELDTLKVDRMIFGGNETQVHITDEKIESLLSSLGFRVSSDRWVQVPAWRGPSDINHEADLIEEIARIYGFNAIPELPYKDILRFVPFSREVERQRNLENLLSDKLHYDQIETYPWILEKWIEKFDIDTTNLYSMKNPITPEQKYLRPRMRPSLLESIEKNAPFFEEIKIFDIGRTWLRGSIGEGKDTSIKEKKGIPNHVSESSEGSEKKGEKWKVETGERSMLCVGVRKKLRGDWKDDFLLELKGIVDLILRTLNIKGKLVYEASQISYFHPKQQANIKLNNQLIGSLHTLHPYQIEKLKLPAKGQCTFLELDMEALNKLADQQKKKGKGLAKYESLQDQIIWRDLSFIIEKDLPYGLITDALSKVKEIVDIKIFDLYKGENIPTGKKSISCSIKIVPLNKESLKTEDINAVMNKAIEAVKKVGGRLREVE